jgi:FkbM family methyltransferase
MVAAVDCVAEHVLISSANACANRFNNLTVLQYAVTERALGKVRVDSCTKGFVVSEPILGDMEKSEPISIDELSAKFGLCDLLKIDVEGYETCIFRGATQTLAAISALALEIHGGGAGLQRYKSSPSEVMKLIAPHGFQGGGFNPVAPGLRRLLSWVMIPRVHLIYIVIFSFASVRLGEMLRRGRRHATRLLVLFCEVSRFGSL